MLSRKLQLLFTGLLFIALTGCNSYEKVVKSDDINYKLKKADEYFEKKQYHKSVAVYESLMPMMKGTRNFEQLYLRYAYSNYYLKDYLSSSYHFKNFVSYFPSSKDAEEAEFLAAVSLYKLSPKASLEQTNTIKAMEAMQSFINTYPKSARLNEANVYITEMRKKLEVKEADAAKLYYNIGHYKAAGVAYKSVMDHFPESPNNDYYQYMIIRSLYKYAKASIKEKQEERYVNAANAYLELKENYPTSSYLPEAEKYYSQSNNVINQLRNEHQ